MSDAASIAVVAVSGSAVTAVFAQVFGVDHQVFTVALFGGLLGLTWAPPARRFRSWLTLVCVVLGSAVIATYLMPSNSGRNALAFVLSAVFHPLIRAAIERIPMVLDGVVERLRGNR